MIPTKEERDKKYQELRIKYNFNNSMMDIQGLLKEYSKWYAAEIIDYCAEVAECVDNGIADEDDNGDMKWFSKSEVYKQSILNVKNEL